MKQKYFIAALAIAFLACTKQAQQESKAADVERRANGYDADIAMHHTKEDTICIEFDHGYQLKYAQADFNQIVDAHEEFFKEYPDHPDMAYSKLTDKEEFGSEAGQDSYYALYAYFLKQQNGDLEFAEQRRKLIQIYTHINSLFGQLEYGGTYFGHQMARIPGYAEYSIFLLPKSKDDLSKTYDISKQKDLYISSLHQIIEDESEIDFRTLGQEKINRSQSLHKLVDQLDALITDIFYLRRAQAFQYQCYEYY